MVLDYRNSEDDIAGRKVRSKGRGYDLEGICSTMPYLGDDICVISRIPIVAGK